VECLSVNGERTQDARRKRSVQSRNEIGAIVILDLLDRADNSEQPVSESRAPTEEQLTVPRGLPQRG
jgi:hypothetical protein